MRRDGWERIMGRMVDGAWQADEGGTPGPGGRFQRPETQFRDRIAPGTRFAPAAGRYHLYVSLACPWAHRTLILRHLKGLEEMISLSVTHWLMGEQGWSFEPGEGVIPDAVNGARYLHEVYAKAAPRYSGRVTVPVLWDRQEGTIVNNESAEVIRILNSAFDGIGARPGDWYPPPLRAEIDAVNERVYATLNNGVYRAGFARTQEAYDEAFHQLFDTLGELETLLPAAATSPVTGSPRPTGASSPRSCASTPSTTCTSAATGAGSSTTRTSGPTLASSTSGPGSPRRSRWTRSRPTTTRPTTR
jgi:glutathionyl-hydroquinone reductase